MKVACEQCGDSWSSPKTLQHSTRHELAFLFRSDRVAEGLAELRLLTKVSLRDSKAIYLHMSKEKGKCHRCSGVLDGAWLTHCVRCGSVNYDL